MVDERNRQRESQAALEGESGRSPRPRIRPERMPGVFLLCTVASPHFQLEFFSFALSAEVASPPLTARSQFPSPCRLRKRRRRGEMGTRAASSEQQRRRSESPALSRRQPVGEPGGGKSQPVPAAAAAAPAAAAELAAQAAARPLERTPPDGAGPARLRAQVERPRSGASQAWPAPSGDVAAAASGAAAPAAALAAAAARSCAAAWQAATPAACSAVPAPGPRRRRRRLVPATRRRGLSRGAFSGAAPGEGPACGRRGRSSRRGDPRPLWRRLGRCGPCAAPRAPDRKSVV